LLSAADLGALVAQPSGFAAAIDAGLFADLIVAILTMAAARWLSPGSAGAGNSRIAVSLVPGGRCVGAVRWGGALNGP
jgi:hypothetical protein